jgi:hypothetical protein
MPLLSANIDNYMYSFGRNNIIEYSKLYKQTLKTEGIICDDPFYTEKNNVVFKYKGINNVKLKLISAKYQEKESLAQKDFGLIIGNNVLRGIYYPYGIENLMYSGGAINTNDSLLQHKPVCREQNNIPIYLFIKADNVIPEMIPEKTSVYFINNTLYVTPFASAD